MTENKVIVSIAGAPLHSFMSLTLHQSINTHHSFEITLDVEAGEARDTHTLEKSRTWIGKPVTILMGGTLFIGIATYVNLTRSKGNHGYIAVSGYSRTFMLESEPHLASWLNKGLTDIVKAVTDKAGVKALINPEYTAPIEYESQYMESHFRFIQRLAKQHCEWLYYDGQQLIFGKPEKGAPTVLEYGKDLDELGIHAQTLARPTEGFSFSSSSNRKHQSASPDAPQGLNDLGQAAFNASLELFKTPSNQFTEARVTSKSELDAYLKKKQQSDTAESHYITAQSERLGLTVGSVIDVKTAMQVFKTDFITKSLGTYIITEITHFAGMGGAYHNTFTALPDAVQALPEPDVPLPAAQTQMATVVSNDDPKKKGRVQVKMNWQTGEMKTSWIRVLTPDAGSSGDVASNRGFVFIPEKDDQVLVSFRYNDPNRPYVAGSLFNGQTGGGGSSGNKSKSITTRSGSSISFDDEKGSVTIKDKTGKDFIVIDGKDAISITTSKNIVLSNGTSSITMEDGKLAIAAEEIMINGSKYIVLGSGNETIAVSNDDTAIGITGEKIIIEASETGNVSAKTLSIESTTGTINGATSLDITGGLVKINS